MDKKTICYLCKGCDIGDALNFEGLTEAVNEVGVDEIKEHDALCSPEGVEMIQADVEAGATHLLLGACSPRVKTDEFSFGDAIIERCP